jgi:hypothetical protein
MYRKQELIKLYLPSLAFLKLFANQVAGMGEHWLIGHVEHAI